MENLRDSQSEKTTAKANADQFTDQSVQSAQMTPPLFQLQASVPEMDEIEESSEQDSLEVANSDTEPSSTESVGETEISSPIQSNQGDDTTPFQLRADTPVSVSPLPAAQVSAPPIQSKISPELEEIEEIPEHDIGEKIFSGAPMPPEDPDSPPPSDNNAENTGPPIIQQKKESSLTEFKPFQLKQEGNEIAPLPKNDTGLPDSLKSGIESLSGSSLDDVKVHYNSSQPAQFQAYAYAQGADIHVAPGQEQHLAHEAWHVVQQKQGRVTPTTEVNGVAVNDDVTLETEADVMGDKAMQLKSDPTSSPSIVQEHSFPGQTMQRDEDTSAMETLKSKILELQDRIDPGTDTKKRGALLVEAAGHVVVGGILLGLAVAPNPLSVLTGMMAGGQFLVAICKFIRALLGKRFPKVSAGLIAFEGAIWAASAIALAVFAGAIAAAVVASVSAAGGFIKMIRGGIKGLVEDRVTGARGKAFLSVFTKFLSVSEAIIAAISGVAVASLTEGAKIVGGILGALISVIKGTRGSGALDSVSSDDVTSDAEGGEDG